jgi:hypothetical protein
MGEFLSSYGIWILLIGGMFLMHRLGIGCCGGHSHGKGHGHGDAPKAEPKPTETKVSVQEKPDALAASSPPRAGSGD